MSYKNVILIIIMLASLSFLSCSTPGLELYQQAESHFAKGEYDDVVNKTTQALDLTKGEGDATGKYWLLRAQAYVATNRIDEAITDYQKAIKRGIEYSSSYALLSDPKPGAKAEWFRTFSRYFNHLGIAYAKAGKYEDALVQFRNAIEVAGESVGRVDLTDQLVGEVFGGEVGKRQEFTKTVGAYCYNAGMMEEKLGQISSAKDMKELAVQLDYDKSLVAVIE